MYLIREQFNTKPGKAKDLVSIFKQASEETDIEIFQNMKVMTDIATTYWTVVIEYEVESLDEFGEKAREFTSSPEVASFFSDYLNIVEGGQREIFRIE